VNKGFIFKPKNILQLKPSGKEVFQLLSNASNNSDSFKFEISMMGFGI